MQRKAAFIEDEYYHLYNRGVDKRAVFTSSRDYQRFMMLLYLANDTKDVRISNILRSYSYEEIFSLKRSQPLIAIGAFCLLPNHFHILATPLVENGISRYMLKLQTAYSMYFNTKNNRTGSLFQGPFKSEYASEDRYLKYLFAYIHLNPAKLKDSQWRMKVRKRGGVLQSFVQSYPYSSLREYLDSKPRITTPNVFPKYFLSHSDVIKHTEDWLVSEEENEQG